MIFTHNALLTQWSLLTTRYSKNDHYSQRSTQTVNITHNDSNSEHNSQLSTETVIIIHNALLKQW
jgi:hypothetical protein